jgi:hypothetical protein
VWFHRGVPESGSATTHRRRLLVAILAICGVAAVAAMPALLVRDDGAPVTVATTPPTTATSSTTTTSTLPPTVVPVSTDLASPKGEIAAYDAPAGREVAKVGLWYGYPMTMPVLEERGDWLRIMMPERPNGLTAWVSADQVTRSTSPWRMVLDLSETRVHVYKGGYEVWSAPVGIGKDSTRTPTGSFFVAVIEQPGPAGYGPIVLNLNAHSEDIDSWEGTGDAITAFHGPFGAEQLIRAGGGKVSNGCVRMLPEDQIKMVGITLGTPVDIIV